MLYCSFSMSTRFQFGCARPKWDSCRIVSSIFRYVSATCKDANMTGFLRQILVRLLHLRLLWTLDGATSKDFASIAFNIGQVFT